MPDWLMDILVSFGDAWVAWTVVGSSALVYALMTLTLRVSEPRELAERLRLTHGHVSDDTSADALNYRLMRRVLTTVRTSSAMVFVMGSMNLVEASGGELTFGTLALLGVGIVIGLIVFRLGLDWLADACYEDVEMWLQPLVWSARKLGTALRFGRRDTNSDRNGSEASHERAEDILTVARNLASDDVMAADVMVPVSDVVAVKAGMSMGDMHQLIINADTELAVVCGDSINDVRGTVHATDVLRSLWEGGSPDSSSDSLLRPALVITPTQHLANVVKSFRGHQGQTGIVIGEDGTFMGTLTYSRLIERLFTNGDAAHGRDGATVAVATEG